MTMEPLWEDDRILWKAFILSLMLHAFLFRFRGLVLPHREGRFIEVDMTHMGSPVASSGASKERSHGSRSQLHKKTVPPPSTDDVAQPRENVAPKPETEPSPPTPEGPSEPSLNASEYGVGDGGSNVLSQIPRLLNFADLRAILKRLYPEQARSAGREGTVVLDIHINTDGRVTSTDIVQSAGSDFDEAAKRATALLRFTPAYLGSQRVNVKMRQAIQFKLTD